MKRNPLVESHPDACVVVNAELRRVDDLREAESRRVNEAISAESRRVNEQMELREAHAIQLSIAEAKRIDAIRSVDVAAVAVANDRQVAQAAILASQVATSAETLRKLVEATAATVAQQLASLNSAISDRLTALERSSYKTEGTVGGTKDMGSWIFAGIMGFVSFLGVVAGVAGVIYAVMSNK